MEIFLPFSLLPFRFSSSLEWGRFRRENLFLIQSNFDLGAIKSYTYPNLARSTFCSFVPCRQDHNISVAIDTPPTPRYPPRYISTSTLTGGSFSKDVDTLNLYLLMRYSYKSFLLEFVIQWGWGSAHVTSALLTTWYPILPSLHWTSS